MILLQLLVIVTAIGGFLYLRRGGRGLYAPGSRRLPDWWPLAAAALLVVLVEVLQGWGSWTDRDLAGSGYNPASMSEAALSADLVTITDQNRGLFDPPAAGAAAQTSVDPDGVMTISRLNRDGRSTTHVTYRASIAPEAIRNRSACGQRMQVRYDATSNAGGVPPISGERTIRLAC